jgi:hypothetical protein
MKKVLLLILVIGGVSAALYVPRCFHRSTVEATIKSFRVDEAVWEERQKSPRDRTSSADQFLDPPYLKKYGLDMAPTSTRTIIFSRQAHSGKSGR